MELNMKIEPAAPSNLEEAFLRYSPPNEFTHLNCIRLAQDILDISVDLPEDDLVRLYVYMKNNPNWLDEIIDEKKVTIIPNKEAAPGDVVLVDGPVRFENDRQIEGLQLGFIHHNMMTYYVTNHGIEIGMGGTVLKTAKGKIG